MLPAVSADILILSYKEEFTKQWEQEERHPCALMWNHCYSKHKNGEEKEVMTGKNNVK